MIDFRVPAISKENKLLFYILVTVVFLSIFEYNKRTFTQEFKKNYKITMVVIRLRIIKYYHLISIISPPL